MLIRKSVYGCRRTCPKTPYSITGTIMVLFLPPLLLLSLVPLLLSLLFFRYSCGYYIYLLSLAHVNTVRFLMQTVGLSRATYSNLHP